MEKIGLNNSIFELRFNYPADTGSLLITDPIHGKELVVLANISTNKGYIHFLRISNSNPEDYIKESEIVSGLTYYKIGNKFLERYQKTGLIPNTNHTEFITV